MAILSQDFTTYQGDRYAVIGTVVDNDGNVVSIAAVREIIFTMARSAEDAVLVTKKKSTGGISLPGGGVDGKFYILLLEADTAQLSSRYLHKTVIQDSTGAWSTVMLGTATIAPSPIWTYSGDPRSSDKDAVRFWMGDTNSGSQLVMDGEIYYSLTLYPNPMLCAAKMLRGIAAKYAGRPDKAVGDLRISWSQIAKQYMAQADTLESQANAAGSNVYAAGVSVSDILLVEQDTDRPIPPFRAGQFDNPSGPNNTTQDPWTSRGND